MSEMSEILDRVVALERRLHSAEHHLDKIARMLEKLWALQRDGFWVESDDQITCASLKDAW